MPIAASDDLDDRLAPLDLAPVVRHALRIQERSPPSASATARQRIVIPSRARRPRCFLAGRDVTGVSLGAVSLFPAGPRRSVMPARARAIARRAAALAPLVLLADPPRDAARHPARAADGRRRRADPGPARADDDEEGRDRPAAGAHRRLRQGRPPAASSPAASAAPAAAPCGAGAATPTASSATAPPGRGPALPTQVGSNDTWSQVSAGGSSTCGVRTNHSLYCWGLNHRGQVGDGGSGHVDQAQAGHPGQDLEAGRRRAGGTPARSRPTAGCSAGATTRTDSSAARTRRPTASRTACPAPAGHGLRRWLDDLRDQEGPLDLVLGPQPVRSGRRR